MRGVEGGHDRMHVCAFSRFLRRQYLAPQNRQSVRVTATPTPTRTKKNVSVFVVSHGDRRGKKNGGVRFFFYVQSKHGSFV